MDFSGLLLKEHTIWGGLRWNLLTEKRLKKRKCLEQYGYKVYSQNDEDGIIQEIFRRIGVTNKTFIEFGVQNGLESNCHYLLFQGWNGLWMDGDGEAIREIQKRFYPVLNPCSEINWLMFSLVMNARLHANCPVFSTG